MLQSDVRVGFMTTCPNCNVHIMVNGIPAELNKDERYLYSKNSKYPVPMSELTPDKTFTPDVITPTRCTNCNIDFLLRFLVVP